MKKENKDKTVPVARLMRPFIFFFFKVVRANDIKMVIKVNHAKILKECIVNKFKTFLMIAARRQKFRKVRYIEHRYFRIEYLCHKTIHVAG